MNRTRGIRLLVTTTNNFESHDLSGGRYPKIFLLQHKHVENNDLSESRLTSHLEQLGQTKHFYGQSLVRLSILLAEVILAA